MGTLKKILSQSLVIAIALAVAGCHNGGPQMPDLPRGAEAVSFLGDTLFKPELPAEVEEEYSINLQSAMEDYRLDPEEADAVIWLGRRTAYLGNYRDAIDIFTEGIYKHPEDPRMYRHRGHRFITVRMPDRAIEDFETAVSLIRGQPDQVEPDGLPNPLNQPKSTLHTNIWYHLGLAHYINGNYREAVEAYRNCLEASENDDMLVATLYWYYMTERRLGNDEAAGRLLDQVEREMDVIENDAYHNLLLVFKGIFDPDRLYESSDDALQNATLGYGIGNWHFINGRTDRALNIWQDVIEAGNWPAFGYIAAEAELARL